MWPNRFGKNMVIPLKVVNGGFSYLYGGRLPILLDDTICDLIVPAVAITDEDFLKKLQAVHVEELAPKNATIFTAVSSRQVPSSLRKWAFSPEQLSRSFEGDLAKDVYWDLNSNNPDSLFVEVNLKDPLQLELRGTKHSRLKRAWCVIPALKDNSQDNEAVSLNHAYRLISEKFEPDRISHAGNVFRKMVYLDDRGCHLLDKLRKSIEATHEHPLEHHSLSAD